MAGHSPAPTVAAVERQLGRGITLMLPTEDAIAAGDELRRRFGLRYWQFTITATDANRFSLRLARHVSGRSKVVVHDHCYHGSVDETFASLDADGQVVPSQGNIGPAVDPALTTRVVPFNDVAALERALADRRRRRGAHRAGPHERRDRPTGPRLPRRRPPPHPRDRDDPDHRRDPHDLRRPGRGDRRLGPRPGHARHRQDDRRRDPGRDVRLHRGARRAGSRRASRSRTSTSAASAGRSPATPCR